VVWICLVIEVGCGECENRLLRGIDVVNPQVQIGTASMTSDRATSAVRIPVHVGRKGEAVRPHRYPMSTTPHLQIGQPVKAL
jgi:hypothetical protein